MPHQNVLFYENSLGDQLRARRERVASIVDGISQDQFLISTDEQVIALVEAQLRVEPVVLHEEARTMQQQESKIDVSGDPRRRYFVDDDRGPIYIPGTKVIVSIPFLGEEWTFRYRPGSYWSSFPHGEVREARNNRQGELIVTIEQSHDANQEAFKHDFEEEMRQIRNYLGNVKQDIDLYNQQLASVIQSAVQQRRQRLERHKGIAALLDIPLQSKPGAPSLEPIRVEVRPLPKLPVAPKTGLQPEPGITLEMYERVLSVIRHEARTYETAPDTFAKLEEEELRNVILSHLNGHFQGAAAGEVFRRNGKTDICIQEKNRAAFVGECKVWHGAGQVPGDLDQLLGYLTWRDSKAAFVVFNKTVKEFSSILEILPKAISEHRCFVRRLECEHSGEWRVLMRSIEDEGRTVTVHVFAINIYTDTKKAGPRARPS
jgi:hypothetical protein